MKDEKGDRTGGLVVGIVMITIGILFLADRLGWFGLDPYWSWWRLWPVIVIVVGLVKFLPGHTAGDRAGAVFTVLLGTWFLAVTNDWYGLSFSNSWPLVLVAIGGGMVARSLVDRASRRPAPGGEGGHDAL